ncbi:quinone-dependent dihydroorotate dehydrogenase [Paenibacillus sp. ACRRX]|uniref:quinone-dependent dihydroorotate dehydrogenase n=1 Tax=unclassified Paenibacillus TaxID=185978 RepID=UPI001EF72CB4|nr:MULTISPECIES: quinone-dependent dihydroorotate dehydrogenase [unclassified Paenibacillus]MCG7406062.1 quinone-dependent dihydroorotate dehydrogenase [Paenibacillus sp. ACRRX]MDK8182516.1 quinone-dependent dihydroorotate dehydrogenase [Paenibacillus sp. UMB4589-SE434]
MLYRYVGKPMFFRMDPERAHHLVLDGMATAAKVPGSLALLRGMYGVKEEAMLATDLFGLHFHSPIGLAAGLDKNATSVEALSSVGFGFIEVGTVTPVGQSGNEKPRMFRLPEDEALINRMGFNNDGAEMLNVRLKRLDNYTVPVFVNIGKNKVTPNEQANEDYLTCIRTLYDVANLFVVNISSPNTPNLRNLQHGDELRSLLEAVVNEMNTQNKASGKNKAVLVKIAPDVSDEELAHMTDTIVSSGVNGIIATNTTLSRMGTTHSNRVETGGLSGKPLTERSTEVIRQVYRLTEGKLPIIGSGGVFTAKDAYAHICAGASLVEIYTSFIYRGPEITRELARGIKQLLEQDGYKHISEAVGRDHK